MLIEYWLEISVDFTDRASTAHVTDIENQLNLAFTSRAPAFLKQRA